MFPDKLDFDDITDIKNNGLKSRFAFLIAHDGLKHNKMHLLVAPTHSGKSTMTRSLLVDAMIMNPDKKFMIWLTEETKEEFLVELKKCYPHDKLSGDNLRIFSQQNYQEQDTQKIKDFIEQCIEYDYCDFLFVDNITTSPIYMDKPTKEQAEIAMWFKNISKKIGLFLIAHTNNNDFNNRLLDETDIRGSKTITNLTEFMYILQPIRVGDTLYQFLMIKKHRGEDVAGTFYRLNYDKRLYSFRDDVSVRFDDIAWLFQQRNQLSKKVKR